MPTLLDIQHYCDKIAEAFKPQRIVLFGSYAYGKPTPDSDVDVLVVMKKARRLWMDATQKIHEKVSAGFPVDVIVRDPDFLNERLREGDTFLEEITSKGRVMYETATRDWIEKAEADHLAAVDLARRRKLPLHDMVCFHCQQSAEKYLKARLEEAGIHFPKTHDLEAILALTLTVEPLWSALLPATRRLKPFGVLIRYPGNDAS